jgi:hypothetical protein
MTSHLQPHEHRRDVRRIAVVLVDLGVGGTEAGGAEQAPQRQCPPDGADDPGDRSRLDRHQTPSDST